MTEFLDAFGSYDFFVRESLILILLAFSIYVLLNAGMFAVPQVGFMAIGAYASAILSAKHDVPFPLALLVGVLAGVVAGLVLAVLLARLNGIYLAISTIAFGEMIRVTVRNLDVTGGPAGIVGIPRDANDLYIVGTFLAVIYILVRVAKSRFGLAITLIREDSLTASHQGASLTSYRITLFCLSGAIAGLAGALYVHLTGFVEPSLFNFDLLVEALAATVVGGMLSVFGPLLGGAVIFGLPEFLTGLADYKTMVNGGIIVLVIAFAPSGIVSLVTRIWDRTGLGSLLRRGGSRLTTTEDDVWTGIRSGAKGAGTGPILTTSDVRKSFGGIRALDGVTLEVERGEILGLIGPNGSGKTSLLNVISGVYRADSGVIAIDGFDVVSAWGRPERVSRHGISRTFQAIRLIPDLSVAKNVSAGAYRWQEDTVIDALLASGRGRKTARSVESMVYNLLEELGMSDVAEVPAGSLPYGMQRKVEIARALVSRPEVLLLDEPTAGMTTEERDEVFRLVEQVRSQGVTVIVVEHDVSAMTAYCDRLAVLNFGSLLAIGDPHEVIKEGAVIDAYIGHSS